MIDPSEYRPGNFMLCVRNWIIRLTEDDMRLVQTAPKNYNNVILNSDIIEVVGDIYPLHWEGGTWRECNLYHGNKGICSCSHLHTLQNEYFKVTGKELQIDTAAIKKTSIPA